MKKLVLVMIAAVLLAVIAAGCGSGGSTSTPGASTPPDSSAAETSGNSSPPASAEPKEDVKLVFTIWGSDLHKKLYEDLAAKYKQLHPHVSVDVQIIPYADYQQKMAVMLVSRTAPDVAWVHENMIPQLLAGDRLLDLTALQADPDYGFDDLTPASLQQVEKDGKYHGVAFSTPPQGIFFNKTLFESKGLKTPLELYQEGNWTVDELLKAARMIAEPEKGIYGIKTSGNWQLGPTVVTWLVKSFGGNFLNEDATAFTLNSPEGEQALQTYMDMIFKDKSHPLPGDQTVFNSGQLGMQPGSYSLASGFRQITDFEWDLAPMPKGPRGAGNVMGYAAYAALADTKHPEEAISFLKFLTSAENMAVTSEFFVPSRKSVLESEQFIGRFPLPSREAMLTLVDQMEDAEVFVAPANWQEINVQLTVLMDALYTQQKSVKEVLEEMEKNVSPLLGR